MSVVKWFIAISSLPALAIFGCSELDLLVIETIFYLSDLQQYDMRPQTTDNKTVTRQKVILYTFLQYVQRYISFLKKTSFR